MGSVHTGKEGERELGRFLLQNGYLAWRTQQNRGSVRDDESDDVSAGMVPEHMLVRKEGEKFLDGYYIDRSKHPHKHRALYPLDSFSVIPNINIEVKKGYDAKTYNKQFQGWVDKVKKETPQGHIWVIFYYRKYSGEWRACFKLHGIEILTTTQEETAKALPIIERTAKNQQAKT